MANPAIINVPADQWTKVATAVTSGLIHRIETDPNKYLQTFRLTGEAAPTNITDGALAFKNGDPEIISNSVNIDVYIYPVKKSGVVRVDI